MLTDEKPTALHMMGRSGVGLAERRRCPCATVSAHEEIVLEVQAVGLWTAMVAVTGVALQYRLQILDVHSASPPKRSRRVCPPRWRRLILAGSK